MKKREITNTFEPETLVESVARWLNVNRDTQNLNGIARKAEVSRFALIALMAGKTDISHLKLVRLDQVISDICDRGRRIVDMSKEQQNEAKKKELGLIEANDDEFI